MEHDDTYRFDQVRHHAAIALRPEHISDFQRLLKGLRVGSRFQFLVAEYNDANYRRELIAQIDAVLTELGQTSVQLSLNPESYADFSSVEADLRRLATEHQAIHVLGGDSWFSDERWEAFNIRREAVAREAPIALIFWLSTLQISRLALMAPDLWAWRSGVFSFSTVDAPLPLVPVAQRDPVDTRTLAERSKRIAELREYLDAEPPYPDEIRLPLLDELADLYISIGKIEAALTLRRDALSVLAKYGDERSVAVFQGRIADIMQARGQYDEALQSRHDLELPIFEKLGDVREVAITQGKIADIMQARGQIDEALQIYREIALPASEKSGDVRLVAVMQGRIADILQSRGELGMALRSRVEFELPIFEKLGDLREVAITQSKIAYILQACGELEQALGIFQQLVLPVFVKLGEAHSVAFIQGKIAEIQRLRESLKS